MSRKYVSVVHTKDGDIYVKDVEVRNSLTSKADKSEMSITPGTGANADKTTIQLKQGTSATVLTQHQDISGKQDIIQDLSSIRSGALAGATAYQKPQTGIPSSDMSSAVQTSLGKADTAQQPATTLAGYGITDGATKTELQELESEVDSKLDEQDAAIALLDGHDVVIVDDHTTVVSPDTQKIYREPYYTEQIDGQGTAVSLIGNDYYSYLPIVLENDTTYVGLNNCVFINVQNSTIIGNILTTTSPSGDEQYAVAKQVAGASDVADLSYTKTNDDVTPTKYTDWMCTDNTTTPVTWKKIATYDFPGVDDVPTAGSNNLVTSGGVDKELNGTDNFTVGGYINQDGYTITPNSNYAYSDYFDITPGTTVKFNKASGTDVNVYALMYKSDGSTDYWTIDTGSTYRSVSVPAGFIKARFSFVKTSAANASVGDNIIWEKIHTSGVKDDIEELNSNTVKVTAQSLTDEQKTQAKANLGLPPAVDNRPIAGSNNLVKSSGVFDENNKLWKSITAVSGHISVEYYQGNTSPTGKPQSNNIRVSTMPFLCTGKVKVSCGGDVGIGYTYRYKTLDVFVNGGTLNEDFIEHIATSDERTEIIIDENTDFPYCLVTFWNKNDNTAAIPVATVESSGTAISSMDNSIQNIEDVLDGVDKIINLGTITKSDRVFAIWFDNPVYIDDYSNISIETTRLDSNTTSLYIYALYSNVTTDRQELLPKIEASVKSMRDVPKDVSDSSHAKKQITGLYIYNPEDISYSFDARVLLSAKDKSYSRLSVAGVSANFASIPAYYHDNDYLWKKMKIINSYLRSSILTGDAFYFVTDTHWEYNQKHSPALIQELNEKLNIQRIFHGGDVYHNGEIIDNYEVDCINSYRKAIGKDNVYACSGNHEFLSGDTYGDVYVETGMHLNDVTFGGTNKQYYYLDNKAKKIRYIVLYGFGVRVNGSYTYGFDDAEQLNWFEDIALDVETGWDVIIFTHYVASPSNSSNTYEYIGYYNNFKDIVDNYNGNGRIVSIITGHTHRDFVVLDRTKVPIIVTTCDHNAFLDNSFENLTVPRTSGTINEQAFDVVIYDKENVLMHFVRIGSQAYNKLNLSETNQQVDCRSIYCEPLVVGNTKTLPTYLTGTLTWASSDSEVASVNNGVVTAVAAGYVRIDVTDASSIQSFFMEIK